MPAFPSSDRPGLFEILAAELAPREGRWAAVTRIAVGTALTVAVAMTFRIPEPTYMAYIVFLISKDDRKATVMSAVGGAVAVTLAVLMTLALSIIDTAEPALRIPALAATTFLAMYTTRTFALGQLTYLAGFVIVLLHSLTDDVPDPEILTRAILWAWVIVVVPVAITLAMQALFGHDIEVTIRRAVRQVLQELKGALIRGDFQRRIAQWRGILVPLLDAKRDAAAENPDRIGDGAPARLLDALTILEVVPVTSPAAEREAWSAQVDACLRAVDGAAPASLEPAAAARNESTSPPAAAALTDSLAGLRAAIAPGEKPAGPLHEREKHSLFAADAFSNPSHWQFALKTTAAVMISYATYTLLDWPGLRTSIVTCFFVALGSFGETVHKLILRLSGALIGGAIAGLCIVFVLPHLTDIGQLCLLIMLVSLGAAWIATSSEFLAYAGLQIAFAFLLGVLQGFAPATDLTVLRDRIVGIVLGNVVMTLVFSSLWPESIRTSLRNASSEVIRSLSSILKNNTAEMRARVARALARAEHFRALSSLELRTFATPAAGGAATPALSAVERLAGATFVAAATPLSLDSNAVLAKLAHWMDLSADCVAQGQKLPDVPDTEFSGDADPGTREPARRAVEQLKLEIGHVASTSD